MTKDERNLITNWLSTNQSNGFFNGQPEEDMDFSKLDDESLEWYNENWRKPDIDEDDEEVA